MKLIRGLFIAYAAFIVCSIIILSNYPKEQEAVILPPIQIILPEDFLLEQEKRFLLLNSETYNDPEPDLDTIQCPIPKSDRVPNYTGIQCVFSSIEMLGRWAEEPKLMDPPITSRSNCKSYSDPYRAGAILKELNVKFEQTNGNREAGIKLIKKAMAEGRGCLWDVPGHAMVLVHYDEEKDRVCWVNNSDPSLKIQTTDIAGFKKRWSSWVLVIYADNDIIPYKIGSPASRIPIKEWTHPKIPQLKELIPMPNKEKLLPLHTTQAAYFSPKTSIYATFSDLNTLCILAV